MSQAAAKMTESPLPMFTAQPRRGRSGDRRGRQGRAAPPARADRADRLGEHRLARRARGAGLGADQQVCRGLSRPALLRRLRVRRQGRAARDRPRLQAVRLQLRQRPAALRRAGQPGGVHGAAAAGRHLHGHGARPGRPSHARLARQPVGQVVQGRVLRREARQPPDRLRADGEAGAPREAQADHRRRLGLFAPHRLRALPQDRRRDRRLLHGRHGALCRPGRGRRLSQPAAARPCRDDDDAQDAARPARRHDPVERRGASARRSTRRCSPACRAGR